MKERLARQINLKNNSPRPAKNFVVDFVFFFLSVSPGGERNLDGTEPTLERWDFIDSEVDLMNKEPPPLGLPLVSVTNSAKPVGVTTLYKQNRTLYY